MARTVEARVTRQVALSDEVCGLTIESLGDAFTLLEPGAHVDVHLSEEVVRQYSLVDWDDAGRWLSLAVKREPEGRGGSLAMHAIRPGDVIRVGGPRNHFRLVDDDRPRVLVAGGIGITPLFAMAKALGSSGRPFDLHYFVRTRALAIFDVELRALGGEGRYALHCDDEEGIPDFMRLLGDYSPDTRFYVCGPEVMLNGVHKASAELGVGTVHAERFAAVPSDGEDVTEAFQVLVHSTGQVLDVPADESILTVLRRAGHDVDSACTEGVCGTCITDVLAGDIDHRDSILTDDERAAGDCMCLCVSRARGARLVLDL